MSSKGADQYRQNSHHVASKEQLVLFVFEKAITAMWEARGTIEQGNKVDAVASLHLARRLFMELQSSLDEEGGEISANLHNLYTYIIREISRAGFEGDAQVLENAIAVAEQLYEGFFEAFSVGDPSNT